MVARQQTKSRERERGKEEQKRNGDRGRQRARLQLVEKEIQKRRSRLQLQYVRPILKKWTGGTVKPSPSPSHLFLSHAWLAALFSQVQRCVTSTQMSLEQGEANEPGIPWEGGIMGHRMGGAYGAAGVGGRVRGPGAFEVTTLQTPQRCVRNSSLTR